jgi:succinate dehydrogenase / fumarate reductase iron-sulfur subunit
MKYKFRIRRFDPTKDQTPYYQEYVIKAESDDKILDCLNKIRADVDGTLAYRMSCAHGVCGSDAMVINGEIGLACQKLVKNYETNHFIIDPLPVFPVMKDLVVDLDQFFKWYRRVKPYLINTERAPLGERVQGENDRKKIEDVIKCILCACCTASCPIEQSGTKYIGPAALVRAHRYIFDTRDKAKENRLMDLNNKEGAYGCKTYFKCTEVCPKGIKVTKAINQIKTEIKK